MFLHLSQYQSFHDYVSLFSLPSSTDTSFKVDTKEHIKNAVLPNYSLTTPLLTLTVIGLNCRF